MDLLGVVIINAVLIAWLWLEICRLKDKIKHLSQLTIMMGITLRGHLEEKQNE